ncbi:hypothetical protein TNCV_3705671 [Trichonephila clavipes]|nr:hypothetical protein TNCV_3705671 [Trichonephila clavipes]
MFGNTRPLLRHSCIGSISEKTTASWRASTHHGVQYRRQCAGHLAKTRHGAYLEYTQNIMLQQQGGIKWVIPPSFICSTNPTAMFLRGHRREASPSHPSTSERWPKGTQKISPGHQFPSHGHHTRQTCELGNQR